MKTTTLSRKLLLILGPLLLGAMVLLAAATYMGQRVEKEILGIMGHTNKVLHFLADIRFTGLKIVASANELLLLSHMETMTEDEANENIENSEEYESSLQEEDELAVCRI